MDGGALLGYGTFGCVFDPPLRCSDRPASDGAARKVGKLGERGDIQNEIEASKVLSGVENSKEYFALADVKSLCKYDKIVKDPVSSKDINECKIECKTIREEGPAQMIYYNMPYGGMTIEKYGGLVKTSKKTPISPRVIITHLLEACAIMTLHNFIHYDIHTGNILFDDKTQLPRLVDFGLSFSVDSINEKHLDSAWKKYAPTHGTEPPEVTIITGVHKGMSYNTVFKEVFNGKMLLKKGQNLLGTPLALQGKNFQKLWTSSQSIKRKDWVTFFKLYWPGFDAWAVGNVIMAMYVAYSMNPVYYRMPDWKSVSTSIKEILRGLVQMSPILRIDCVEALAMFDPDNRVVLSASGKAWLKEKEKMRISF